jgi:hypothetical protein
MEIEGFIQLRNDMAGKDGRGSEIRRIDERFEGKERHTYGDEERNGYQGERKRRDTRTDMRKRQREVRFE